MIYNSPKNYLNTELIDWNLFAAEELLKDWRKSFYLDTT